MIIKLDSFRLVGRMVFPLTEKENTGISMFVGWQFPTDIELMGLAEDHGNSTHLAHKQSLIIRDKDFYCLGDILIWKPQVGHTNTGELFWVRV